MPFFGSRYAWLQDRIHELVCDFSFVNFGFGTFALGLALKSFRLETLAWKLSFWGTLAWELWLRNFSLGASAKEFRGV